MSDPADADLVNAFMCYYEDECYDEYRTLATSDRPTAELAVEDLAAYDPDLAADLIDHPTRVLPAAREAFGLPDWWDEDDLDTLGDEPLAGVDLCVDGLPDDDVYDVGFWNPDDVVETMVAIRGQVTKRSKRKIRDNVTAFECSRCGQLTRIEQSGETLQEPHECAGCERQGPFTVNDRETLVSDYQRIRLQSLPEEMDSTATEQVDIDFIDSLVGTVEPGDRVIVNGIVKSTRVTQGASKKRTRELYVEAHGVEKLDNDHEDVDVEPYKEDIEDLAADDDVFEHIVDSVAPGHMGDRVIKQSIALMLFGGVEKPLPDGSVKRGNSHVLLIGDPGTGKSTLIKWVSNVVGRAEYASGQQTSSAGLTATAVKDDFGGNGWTLEAGTLVRAHNGIACIDELDKMEPADRGGMIEAMSEQEINIDKAASGTLPAKTTVVAAANPKHGSFDQTVPIGDQLDLDPVLLSRFDLWFALTDDSDETKDRDVADHMNTTAHAGQKLAKGRSLTASEKDAVEPEIPPEMFRAYIALARRHTPVFTDDAMDLIAENYVELRQKDDEDDPVPTTARTIEGVHRLSEASARVRLSDEITTEDVERAIEIRDYCLETLGTDPETGKLDAVIHTTGAPTSQHERIETVKGIIASEESKFDDEPGVPDDYVHELAVDVIGMDEAKVDATLDKLNDQGQIYAKRPGYWRVS